MTAPFPPGARLAAYLRDSGGDKQELSTTQQETAIRAWCDKHALILAIIFRDDARPGSSTVGRAGFQAMMKHFRTPGCQETGLIIWNYQRFSRDIDDSQFHRADLRRRGYTIYSINDEIPDNPMGRFFEAALDWKNQQFLDDLSTDVRRGLRALVETHRAVPGTPPRGFTRIPITIGPRRDGAEHIVHRWAPDPQLAPLILQAFSMRAAGASLHQINAATRLYKGINSYPTFFTNPLYKGELHFGDLIIPDYCPPIVPPQLWETVNAMRSTRPPTPHPRRAASSYLLSGLAHCPRCGSPLTGQTARQRDGTDHHRYVCSNWKRTRACDFSPIPMKYLDDLVLDEIRRAILTPEMLASLQERTLAEQSQLVATLAERRAAIRKDLAALRAKIARLTAAIAETGHSRALLESLTALEADEARRLEDLAALDRQAATVLPRRTPADLAATAARLAAALDSSDIGTLRAALRGIISRVAIDRDGADIRGLITVLYPMTHPPPKSVPSDGVPLGAPLHRHSFDHPIRSTLTRPYQKRRRS